MSRKNIIFIIVGILAIVVGGFWYWQQKSKVPESTPLQSAPQPTPQPVISSGATTTLGGQIFEKTQNPLKGQVPATNPFKEQKNPFDVIYKNPFSQ